MNYIEYRRKIKLGINPEPEPKESPPKKAKPPIKKVSDKRKEINKEYKKISQPLWKNKPCRINSPNCTKIAQGIHHLKGKTSTKDLLDTKYMLPACNACNTYVEDHHAWAVNKGFKISKHKKD